LHMSEAQPHATQTHAGQAAISERRPQSSRRDFSLHPGGALIQPALACPRVESCGVNKRVSVGLKNFRPALQWALVCLLTLSRINLSTQPCLNTAA
jgi:hypothetical protein